MLPLTSYILVNIFVGIHTKKILILKQIFLLRSTIVFSRYVRKKLINPV
jgi:hypothetical protein